MYRIFVILILLVNACGSIPINSTSQFLYERTQTIEKFTSPLTSVEIWYGQDLIQEYKVSIENLLLCQQIIYEKSGDTDVLHTTFFIPENYETWTEYLGRDGVRAQVRKNVPDFGFVIAIDPLRWEYGSQEQIFRSYLHELTHIVEWNQNAGISSHHTDPKYWGDNGLLETSLIEALTRAATS